MKNSKDVGMIFDIAKSSYVDGPGIRTTVFFKGCNLKCAWCHNPESQRFEKEMMIYKNKCTGCGKCAEVCKYNLKDCDFCGKCELFCPNDARKICGKEISADELVKEIVKNKVFFENSGGGVTFSGGECMLQIDFLENILIKCKEEGIQTAVDTAGNVPWESFKRILPYTDLFLYDVKAITDKIHKKYTKVSNKLILENLDKLFKNNANVIIRVPVIPDVNDTDKEMGLIKECIAKYNPIKVDYLEYHDMGEHKYQALNREYVSFKKQGE